MKKILVSIMLSLIFSLPLSVGATTADELAAQIQSLLETVKSLQGQLSAQQVDNRSVITEPAYFEFVLPNYPEDKFIFKLTNPEKIREARSILSGEQTDAISVMGIINKVSENYNPDWSYSLDPNSIDFFEIAAEVCEADIRYVEDNLNDVGGEFLPGNRWCPWDSVLTREVRYNEVPEKLSITTVSIPDATVGQSYSVDILGSGGNDSYVWSIISDSLPKGLSSSGSVCLYTPCKEGLRIYGVPQEEGLYNISVLLRSGMNIAIKSFNLRVSETTVIGPPVSGTCTEITEFLYEGKRDKNTNGQVSMLQQFLFERGYFGENISGFFGVKTDKALKKWQSDKGIVSSGRPGTTGYGATGPITRLKIREVSCPDSNVPSISSILSEGYTGNKVEVSAKLTVRGLNMPDSGYIIFEPTEANVRTYTYPYVRNSSTEVTLQGFNPAVGTYNLYVSDLLLKTKSNTVLVEVIKEGQLSFDILNKEIDSGESVNMAINVPSTFVKARVLLSCNSGILAEPSSDNITRESYTTYGCGWYTVEELGNVSTSLKISNTSGQKQSIGIFLYGYRDANLTDYTIINGGGVSITKELSRSVTLTSQKNRSEIWEDGTRQKVTWKHENLTGTADVYLVASDDNSLCLLGSVDVKEKSLSITHSNRYVCPNTSNVITPGNQKVRIIVQSGDITVSDDSDAYVYSRAPVVVNDPVIRSYSTTGLAGRGVTYEGIVRGDPITVVGANIPDTGFLVFEPADSGTRTYTYVYRGSDGNSLTIGFVYPNAGLYNIYVTDLKQTVKSNKLEIPVSKIRYLSEADTSDVNNLASILDGARSLLENIMSSIGR